MNSLLAFALGAGGIVLIDIVLSGDNALVIGAAASRLPRHRQTLAIVLGGIVATVFRIVLTVLATELLRVPLLRTCGGAALLVIACHMLIPQDDDTGARRASDKLLPAILTILIADATMSIDNILAIGALARGDIALVVVGLLVSMVILFVASALIARLIERFWWLLDLAAVVIALTAADLFITDPIFGPLIHGTQYSYAYQAGAVALVLLFDAGVRLWRRRRSAIPAPASNAPSDAPSDAPHEFTTSPMFDAAPDAPSDALPDAPAHEGLPDTTAITTYTDAKEPFVVERERAPTSVDEAGA